MYLGDGMFSLVCLFVCCVCVCVAALTQAQELWRVIFQPLFAVGNVGPLCVDALVCTYAIPHVGYLDEPLVLPSCGNDATSQSAYTGVVTLPLQGTTPPRRICL